VQELQGISRRRRHDAAHVVQARVAVCNRLPLGAKAGKPPPALDGHRTHRIDHSTVPLSPLFTLARSIAQGYGHTQELGVGWCAICQTLLTATGQILRCGYARQGCQAPPAWAHAVSSAQSLARLLGLQLLRRQGKYALLLDTHTFTSI
jgi:hypothetical protein